MFLPHDIYFYDVVSLSVLLPLYLPLLKGATYQTGPEPNVLTDLKRRWSKTRRHARCQRFNALNTFACLNPRVRRQTTSESPTWNISKSPELHHSAGIPVLRAGGVGCVGGT